MKAEITLEYNDEKLASAIARAVSPDNIKVPAGMQIKTIQTDRIVMTTVDYEGRLLTFMATIDDLLSSVSIAEKTVRTATKFR